MAIKDARTTMRVRALSAFSIALLALSLPTAALAQGPESPAPPSTASPPPPNGEGAGHAAEKPVEPEKAGEPAEDKWRASLDAVFGFGATPVVSQRVNGPLLSNETRTAETARYTTTSVNLGLSYELLKDFRLGVLLPVGGGSLSPNETRASTVVGKHRHLAWDGRRDMP